MNQPPRLLQIVPALPPSVEGVSATAAAIAAAIAAEHRVTCSFEVPERSGPLQSAIDAHEPDLVLVHYVNYAYDRHGRPADLVQALEPWALAHPGQLWTYFHEVYASGRPWQRSFYTAGAQRALAARLARASSLCLTSLPEYGEQLRALGYQGELAIRPIVSTIGEPPRSAISNPRAAELVIFGSPGRRRLAYASDELGIASAALGVERILDIGGDAGVPANVDGIPVVPLGVQPAERVSAVLLRARAGFLVYPLDFLGKSSIFAAYAAHGLLPICTGRRRARNDTPRAGDQFWDIAATPELPPGAEERIARNARDWYSDHALDRLVDDFATRLGQR